MAPKWTNRRARRVQSRPRTREKTMVMGMVMVRTRAKVKVKTTRAKTGGHGPRCRVRRHGQARGDSRTLALSRRLATEQKYHRNASIPFPRPYPLNPRCTIWCPNQGQQSIGRRVKRLSLEVQYALKWPYYVVPTRRRGWAFGGHIGQRPKACSRSR